MEEKKRVLLELDCEKKMTLFKYRACQLEIYSDKLIVKWRCLDLEVNSESSISAKAQNLDQNFEIYVDEIDDFVYQKRVRKLKVSANGLNHVFRLKSI